MKKYLALFVILTFTITSIGCQFTPPNSYPYPTNPFPNTPDMSNTDLIVILGVVALAGLVIAVVVDSAQNKQEKKLFAKFGSSVRYVMHEEAPAHAKFLGEVESREGSQTEVKNWLRIQAGQMGGNFLVIDAITAASTDNSTIYSGSGRVYFIREEN